MQCLNLYEMTFSLLACMGLGTGYHFMEFKYTSWGLLKGSLFGELVMDRYLFKGGGLFEVGANRGFMVG